MAFELFKLALLIALLLGAYWLIKTMARGLWDILDDIAAETAVTPTPQHYSFAEQNMRCDECGSGPWHIEWDPESRTRKSRKFYCPNCTGAT